MRRTFYHLKHFIFCKYAENHDFTNNVIHLIPNTSLPHVMVDRILVTIFCNRCLEVVNCHSFLECNKFDRV